MREAEPQWGWVSGTAPEPAALGIVLCCTDAPGLSGKASVLCGEVSDLKVVPVVDVPGAFVPQADKDTRAAETRVEIMSFFINKIFVLLYNMKLHHRLVPCHGV